MKKISLLLITLFSAGAVVAQEPETIMQVNLKDGSVIECALSEIEDITFVQQVQSELPVSFTVPADFSASYVQKVMSGSKQVAEIDKEYVAGLGQVVVVYPCDNDGKAILAKGITTDGVTVAWDASTKKPTVGTAGDPVSTFYVVDGAVVTSYDGDTKEASIRPDVLIDRRGTESESYRLVKIGLQYWTADNIRATKFTDGSDIAAISETQTEEWKANTTGAYLVDSEADWVKIAGLLYNGYCAVSDKMAPEGWRVPSCDDFANIRISVNARTAALYKDSAVGSWGEGCTGTNLTGFSVVATGYFSTATGLASMLTDTYIWTSDSSYDALSRSQAIDFFRVTSTGTNAVFPTKGLNPHSYGFGHAIRLVRE